MKNKTTSLLLSFLIALWAPLLYAKGGHHPHDGKHPHGNHHPHKADKHGGFPGKGEGAAHSNAPSTGTQMKGQERAMEVGQGKKKGLYKKHDEEAPATPAPGSAPQTLPR